MIRCEEFLSQVSELIDQEIHRSGDRSIDADWYQAMMEHVRECRSCSVVFDTIKQTIRLVGDASIFELPEEVSQRLHAALDRAIRQEVRPSAQPEAVPYLAADSEVSLGKVIDLPLPAPAAGRPWWMGPRLAVAAALLLITIVAGIHWMGESQTVYVAGWLSDAHCYATYRRHPERHPRFCMLVGWCKQSGFGVIDAHGAFLPFDPGSTHRVVTLLEATSSPDHIWVQADGRERNGVLQVRHLEIRTPDQRLVEIPGRRGSRYRALASLIAPVGWY